MPAANPDVFVAPISALYESVSIMAQNLAYVQAEVPGWQVSGALGGEIVAVCREFESALYDVRNALRGLEDKLGLHRDKDPHEAPFDTGVVNRDPQVTLELIEHWLARQIQAMHSLVMKLRRLADVDEKLIGVYVLVTESAVNILNARMRLKAALTSISEEL